MTATGDNLLVAASAAEHADARLSLTTTGPLGAPATRFDVDAIGRVTGVAKLADTALPAGLDRDFTWTLKATTVPGDRAIELTELSGRGGGVDFTGSGRLDPVKRLADGRLRFAVADLRPFSGLAGRPIAGAVSLAATAQQPEPNRIAVEIDGSLTRLRTGVPAADALAGDTVMLLSAAWASVMRRASCVGWRG